MNIDRRALMWVGIILILITGLVHLIDAPDSMEEATWKGLAFYANALGAVIAAVGIFRGERTWGWGLGLLIAAASFILFLISRTIGLPGLGVDDDWGPLGIASLIAEGLFVVAFFLQQNATTTNRADPAL